MKKYYTRACNFYYGSQAAYLIKKKLALPLCNKKDISFDKIEIISRENKKVSTKIINLNEIKKENVKLQIKIKKDLKKITSDRKTFFNPSIMGILNLTPDSFSDGGKFNQKTKAFNQINLMVKSGATIIDIGGESTRPGSKTIHPSKELKRISKILNVFKKKFPKVKLSIDTRKSEVMLEGIKNKADIINDISCFSYDTTSLKKIEKYNVWKVIHHMQGTPDTMQIKPKYNNALLDIYDFFEEKIKNNSINKQKNHKIILDPGIGFGKKLKHNLMLISNISLFHSLGFPILIGTSRKRFISEISRSFDTKERVGGTLSSVLFALSQGVQIFRVHDVAEINQGILVFKELLNQ
tara:strand:- start:277 stop:1332 length:1056 start_codon:yes stop_codon:yes gene_type:complete